MLFNMYFETYKTRQKWMSKMFWGISFERTKYSTFEYDIDDLREQTTPK